MVRDAESPPAAAPDGAGTTWVPGGGGRRPEPIAADRVDAATPAGAPRRGGRSEGKPRRRSERKPPQADVESQPEPVREVPAGVPAPHADAWQPSDYVVPEEHGKVRFCDLDLPVPLLHAIADLGFQYCTPIQAKVLPHAMKGENVAGRAQTGTGKTAAFLLSLFTRFLREPEADVRPNGAPRALVLAPTRELVIQIVKDADDLAKYCPLRMLAVYGGMDYTKQENAIRNAPLDLIAATPGRLLDFCSRGVIDLSRVDCLVIDEADRMLDMGFIPDVRRIIRRLPPKNKRRSMLFSATLTSDVLNLASQWMPDPVICEVEAETVTVDAVTQVVYAVAAQEKLRLLYNLIVGRNMNRVLVFGNRRVDTERVADYLHRLGVDCALLSGAVAQKRRLNILEDFRAGKLRVVVATDVAGRGLHVDAIDYVINYDFPYEPEDYVHRIGRTARAGAEGTAISFACESESFIIPEIEELIGRTLPCSVPEEDLLKPLPPMKRARPAREQDESAASRRGGRGGGGSRSGPSRSSSGGSRSRRKR